MGEYETIAIDGSWAEGDAVTVVTASGAVYTRRVRYKRDRGLYIVIRGVEHYETESRYAESVYENRRKEAGR